VHRPVAPSASDPFRKRKAEPSAPTAPVPGGAARSAEAREALSLEEYKRQRAPASAESAPTPLSQPPPPAVRAPAAASAGFASAEAAAGVPGAPCAAAAPLAAPVSDAVEKEASLALAGRVYAAMGRPAEALDALQSLLVLQQRRVPGGRSGDVGLTLASLALLHRDQGAYAAADDAFAQAVALQDEFLPPGDPMRVSTLLQWSHMLTSTGARALAVKRLRAALTLQTQTLGGQHPSTLATAKLLAEAEAQPEPVAQTRAPPPLLAPPPPPPPPPPTQETRLSAACVRCCVGSHARLTLCARAGPRAAPPARAVAAAAAAAAGAVRGAAIATVAESAAAAGAARPTARSADGLSVTVAVAAAVAAAAGNGLAAGARALSAGRRRPRSLPARAPPKRHRCRPL
jgi:tetratricopeptide (TPR) repeat protein